jgi:hypothetical protein
MNYRESDEVDPELWVAWEKFTCGLVSQHGGHRAKWTELKDIIAVIDRAGRELPGVHWAFLPRGGGLEIARGCLSSEPGCLQLENREGGHVYVCKPSSLMCFSFFPLAPTSYLDLQLDGLQPMDETVIGRDRKEEWYGRVLGADGTERRDDYTRLLRGRMMIFARGAYDADFDGNFDRLSRKAFYTCARCDANGGLD